MIFTIIKAFCLILIAILAVIGIAALYTIACILIDELREEGKTKH